MYFRCSHNKELEDLNKKFFIRKLSLLKELISIENQLSDAGKCLVEKSGCQDQAFWSIRLFA